MNYTKAAEELHITQPCITQHIRFLEEYYNTKLFRYQNRTLRLTPAGKKLLSGMSSMKHDTDHLKASVASADSRTELYKMGATRTIGEYYLPKKLLKWLKERPDLSIELSISNTQKLLELLDNGDIDFALVEGYFEKNNYDFITAEIENFIPVCGINFPITALKDFSDILEFPLLLREKGSGTREILERFLALKGLAISSFSQVHTISSIPVIKQMLEQNLGISFLFETAVSEELQHMTLKKIDLPGFLLSHEFTFIWRKNSIFQDTYQSVCNSLLGR